MRQFIFTCLDGSNSIDTLFDKCKAVEFKDKKLGIRELIEFFSSPNASNFMELILKVIGNDVEIIDSILDEATKIQTEYESVHKFIIEKNTTFLTLFKSVSKFAKICLIFPGFIESAEELIETVKKF